ncbi:hypothetical protein AKJ53_01150 [candidate division MSBL1 archaeon SCGC-AAA382F02]|uniref:Ribbon-helix-helix protein CopG domain-containing protein n=1 Tax=candidate division MSBL1 archaeon SCGC-AAA382F02 TaxID=1698282 RepID=A0A133VI96_9EURY|nr:hypothetical protein AKJ53_01150 [candidate division MSBL1 archaeon SCGC-AAA382F02]
MPKSVGVRMDEDLLEKIDQMSEKKSLDRSTLVRKLLRKGYEIEKKERAAEKYRQGKITLSKAAKEAEVTVWEMEKFLVETGYRSEYSVKDLDREISKV